MQALDSPFCAPLYGAYCDARSVYFLTEALLGGELWYHLKCVLKPPYAPQHGV
jgi:cGMP-dependent protein kinase